MVLKTNKIKKPVLVLVFGFTWIWLVLKVGLEIRWTYVNLGLLEGKAISIFERFIKDENSCYCFVEDFLL